MGVAGVILLVIGAFLVFVHVRAKRKAGYLIAARPSKIGELSATAATVASEIEAGGFRQFAELRGGPVCERPLISPLAEAPCLYFRMSITRRYEEEYTTRDSDGRRVRRTRTGSETMSSETDQVAFGLDDTSGTVPVGRGAEFDGLLTTVDRFEESHAHLGRLTMGRFALSVGAIGSDRRTLGYHYREEILPVDRPLTVVGEVSDAEGRLVAGKGGPVFLVSTRTKREIIGSAEKTARITSVLSGLCMLGGIGLLVSRLF